MMYSDTSGKSGLLQDCEFWTNLGDAGVSGNATLKSQFTGRLNDWYHKVVTMILNSQDESDFDDINHTNYPVLKVSLVANQRDYQISASEKMLKIKRIDICPNGIGNTCYKAEAFDSGEYGLGMGNDTDVDANFAVSEPKYDLKNNSIWIYPRATAANVTNSGVIRAEWIREIDEFTTSDTTQEPGFDEPFHRMLSIGASYDWILVNKSENTALITRLEGLLADYEARLKKHFGSKQLDRQYALKGAYIDYN